MKPKQFAVILSYTLGCSAAPQSTSTQSGINPQDAVQDDLSDQSDSDSETAGAAATSIGLYLQDLKDLPDCHSLLLNKLAVTQSQGAFLCTSDGWIEVSSNSDSEVSTTVQGQTGQPGPAGEDGLALNLHGGIQNLDTSAGNVVAGSFDSITVEGSHPLVSIGGAAAGKRLLMEFKTGTSIHHSSSLALAGAGNLRVQTGDLIEFVSLGSGNWREIFRAVKFDSLVHASISDSTWASATATSATTVIFDKELSDTQDEFNNTTGIFTAKQSGNYEVIAQLTNNNGVNWGSGNTFQASLYRNSTIVSVTRQNAWSGGVRQISLRLRQSLRLEVGDQVRLEFSASRSGALIAGQENPSNFLIIARSD
jgi:hypothetical protein